MPRTHIVVVAAMLCTWPGFATLASAQDDGLMPTSRLAVFDLGDVTFEVAGDLDNREGAPAFDLDMTLAPETMQVPLAPRRRGASPMLTSLYASTAILQAIDVHSTLRAVDGGAAEGNPLMSGLVSNKAAFIGVKAAVAVSTIYATRELAKKNKVAAVITLFAINSVYAYVAHHNYRVGRGLR